jgi:hypothetical protein
LTLLPKRMLAQPCLRGNGRSYATGVTANAIEVEVGRIGLAETKGRLAPALCC